jgi:RimJ/RimL family protein N-acetyltransferase
VWVDNPASRRVLEKAGFFHVGRALRGAPARGAMVECDAFEYRRADWSAQSEPERLLETA